MRTNMTCAACLAVAGAMAMTPLVATAAAAPANPGTPPPKPGATAGPRLRVHQHFHSHAAAARVRQADGKEVSGAEAAQAFDANQKVVLADGTVITVQELMDRLGESEGEAKSKGASFAHFKPTGWVHPGMQARIQHHDDSHRTDPHAARCGADAEPSSKAVGPSDDEPSTRAAAPPAPGTPACTAATCTPSIPEKTATWSRKYGHEELLEAHTSFSAFSKTRDANTAECGVVWDSGASVIKKHYNLVKFTADAKATRTGSGAPSVSGSASLEIYGQTRWQKSGGVDGEKLDRTFTIVNTPFDYSFIKYVGIKGQIRGSGTLTFAPEVKDASSPNGTSCHVDIEPHLDTKLTGDGQLVIFGTSKLKGIVSVGLKGATAPIHFSAPTEITSELSQDPLHLNLQFKSAIDATLLAGRTVVWYKIHDACVNTYIFGTKCVARDILGIKTSGEHEFSPKAAGYPFKTTLVNFSGSIPFKSKG